MRIFYVLFSLILLFHSGYSQRITIPTPYRAVKISENLYIDQYEVSFSGYMQYCGSIKHFYSENSPEFRNAFPSDLDKCAFHIRGDKYSKDTLLGDWINCQRINFQCPFNSVFAELPVVGISYEQATAFCKWRSDLLYRHLLLINHVISETEQYFSVEDVISGKIQVLDSVKLKIIPIPNFRLPTVAEWELAASGGLNSKIFPYGIEKQSIQRTKIHNDTLGVVKVNRTERAKPNKFKLHNMIGNVSEMVSTKGVLKGGSWHDDIQACKITNSEKYEAPQPWLGFRCVFEWKIID